MSRPRAATSVATRIDADAALNAARAPSRFGWAIWPWRHCAAKPRWRSNNVVRVAPAHVPQKTSAARPRVASSSAARKHSLCFAGMKRYSCVSWEGVENLSFASTLTGLCNDARWSLATFDVIVAENNMETRCSVGIAAQIISSSFSKSIESIRSASSMTRHLQPLK